MIYVLFVMSVVIFSAAMTLGVVARAGDTGWGIVAACVVINLLTDVAAIMMAVEEFKASRAE